MDRRCNGPDRAIAGRPVMAAGQLDPNGDAIQASMEGGRNRTDRFRQYRACPAMQEAVGLSVTGHRHRRNDLPRAHGLEGDAHALAELTQRDLILVVHRHGNSL